MLYLRQSNLSYISCKFCCRMLMYMLFKNSFACCILRLARNSWKPGNASGCEIGGGISGLIRVTIEYHAN